MTTDETIARLTGIVESLASTVVAHDNQIEGLIRVAEQNSSQIAVIERQWQAYIKAMPRQ
jgi:hypothetical protein